MRVGRFGLEEEDNAGSGGANLDTVPERDMVFNMPGLLLGVGIAPCGVTVLLSACTMVK